MTPAYLLLLQQRVGSTSVGASTARGMGPAGTIQAARAFLKSVDIKRFSVRSETAFRSVLDAVTGELLESLPRKARRWGAARKFLNIFLRNCTTNKYLCEHFALDRIERWLEVPLDSHVGKRLRKEPAGSGLPKWKTVVGLTPEASAAFQKVATEVAAAEGVLRVHLDIKYWRPGG